MKKETYANKLAALLGIDTAEAPHSFKEKPQNPRVAPHMEAIHEEELQTFRAVEGIIYFLQAPELFTPKICKWCNEGFLVSRRNVAHCSYTCLRKSLYDLTHVEWTKGHDYELIVNEVYDGNEPLIIKNLDRIKAIINALPVPNVDARNPVEQLVQTGTPNG